MATPNEMRGKAVAVVGSLNLDLVAAVPRLPLPGETLTGTGFAQHVGGKGANQAVAAARAGAAVRMVGRHGTDGFEAKIFSVLREAAIDLSAVTPAEGDSGVAVILVSPDGGNSIVVVPGANGRFCRADVVAARDAVASAGIVLTQLETPMEIVEATLELTADARAPVMLDPAPVLPLSADILQRIAWLTPNETEAAALLRSPVPDTAAEIGEFAKALLDRGPEHVLLKLGARGAFLATQAGLREWVRAPEVQAVDTTAAGDALNGALAAALVAGADPVEAVRFGVAAAALSVTRAGTTPSLPFLREIEEFRRANDAKKA